MSLSKEAWDDEFWRIVWRDVSEGNHRKRFLGAMQHSGESLWRDLRCKGLTPADAAFDFIWVIEELLAGAVS
jgi:hypothetical protein